jgi:hypothetical protein
MKVILETRHVYYLISTSFFFIITIPVVYWSLFIHGYLCLREESKKTKGSNHDSQNGLRLPMSE